jgi:hypothetical protein
VKRFDLATIDFDKESEEYEKLILMTREQQEKTVVAQNDVNIQNMQDMQAINAQNMEESLRVQREEMQRAQKLQTESQNLSAHQLNQQTEVAKKAAESMGTMGSGVGSGSGGGSDYGSMMANMAMGGAVGSGMAGMMGNMMQGMNQKQNTPPPMPQINYFASLNGQQSGPFNTSQLQQMVVNGQLTKDTHVWKEGMASWELAGNVIDLSNLFGAVPPPLP